MRFAGIATLLFVLFSGLAALADTEAQRRINIVGPVEDITFGSLINAPNGHISFQKNRRVFGSGFPVDCGYRHRT